MYFNFSRFSLYLYERYTGITQQMGSVVIVNIMAIMMHYYVLHSLGEYMIKSAVD